ncbi:hypothetical protein BLOT_004317 [Blomia tropicalis]|nr:hypothetical protein BLOT_004317 [Blomia tropicalis]
MIAPSNLTADIVIGVIVCFTIVMFILCLLTVFLKHRLSSSNVNSMVMSKLPSSSYAKKSYFSNNK